MFGNRKIAKNHFLGGFCGRQKRLGMVGLPERGELMDPHIHTHTHTNARAHTHPCMYADTTLCPQSTGGSLVSFSTQVSRGPRSGTRPATAQSSPQVWQRPGSCASMCPPSIFSHSPICQFSDWHPRKMFFRPRTYPGSLRG